MKKVIRLTENDVEKLVKRIISEEKKSINEGPLGWLRKKFNDDEGIGLSVLNGVKQGDVTNLSDLINDGYFDYSYTFQLGSHNIKIVEKDFNGVHYSLIVDGVKLEISKNTGRKIWKSIEKISNQPNVLNKERIKASLDRYNQKPEDRINMDDAFN